MANDVAKPISKIENPYGKHNDDKPCFIIVLITGCATDIYVFAMMSGEKGSESDDPPLLRLVINGGHTGVIRLPDNSGDQQSLNMGDFWRFNLKSDLGFQNDCIKKSDIRDVIVQEGGTDGWGIASIITVLGNGDRYTLLTTDIDLHQMVDRDPEGPNSDISIYLTITSAL